MKKTILLLPVFLFAALFAQAQNDAVHSFIDRHKNEPAFTFAFISKELFDVTLQTEKSDADWQKVRNIIRNIGSLSILAADSIQNGLELYKEVYELLPSGEFDELLAVRDEQTSVKILVKEEVDAITDLILLVGSPDEFVLVRFSGNIEWSSITSLIGLLDAEEVSELAKSTEKVKTDFQISPNPSTGAFTLRYEETDDAPLTMTLIDPNGRRVNTLQLSGQSTEQIKLGNVAPGFYWVQLQTKNGKVGVKQIQIVGQP